MKASRIKYCFLFFLLSFTLVKAQNPTLMCDSLPEAKMITLNNQIMVVYENQKALYKSDGVTCPVLLKQLNSNPIFDYCVLGKHIIHDGILYFTIKETDISMAGSLLYE